MLELRDIHTYYGNIRAVRGISMTVNAGEMVCLIGANGAGKSTTLMTVSGIHTPVDGSVHFEGQDITGTSAEDRVTLGISQVPEGRLIFPDMTVLENLELGAYKRNDKPGIREGPRKNLPVLSGPAGTPETARRQSQWRRTTDVGDRTCADVASEAPSYSMNPPWDSHHSSLNRYSRSSSRSTPTARRYSSSNRTHRSRCK